MQSCWKFQEVYFVLDELILTLDVIVDLSYATDWPAQIRQVA